jgi:hypothetical protein
VALAAWIERRGGATELEMETTAVAIRGAVAMALTIVVGLAFAGAAAGGPPEQPSAALVQGAIKCDFCASYARHAGAMGGATREVGALPNGVVIHLRCDRPEAVVELQQYTFEKQKLREEYWKSPASHPVCPGCRDLLAQLKGASFEVANSVHGVFTIITSNDPDVVRALHKLASQETKERGVRGS